MQYRRITSLVPEISQYKEYLAKIGRTGKVAHCLDPQPFPSGGPERDVKSSAGWRFEIDVLVYVGLRFAQSKLRRHGEAMSCRTKVIYPA
jgi:hypothetical protein